jgi:Zn-dependent protease with chaperone function
MPVAAAPTFAERVRQAERYVRERLPVADQVLLADVRVQASLGCCATERGGERFFGDWQAQWHLIRLHAGRCRGLSDRELIAVLAHEFGHAWVEMKGIPQSEGAANARMVAWGFAEDDLPP